MNQRSAMAWAYLLADEPRRDVRPRRPSRVGLGLHAGDERDRVIGLSAKGFAYLCRRTVYPNAMHPRRGLLRLRARP